MNGPRTRTLRPSTHGVHSTLFTPAGRPTARCLVIGGSGGQEPTYLAEPLAAAGVAALSVA